MNFIRFKESINKSFDDCNSSSYEKTLRTYRIALVVLILLIVSITTYIISYELTSVNYATPEQYKIVEVDDLNESLVEVTAEFEYLLKDCDGKIGIFKVGEFEPFMTLDVYINTLPYLDRQNLLDGISVVGDDNLRSIIEDFDS